LLERWGANDPLVRHAFERADFQVRKRKRPDMYAALGCPTVSCEAEIKTAYRQRALEFHPDKWMDRPKEDRDTAERHFKVARPLPNSRTRWGVETPWGVEHIPKRYPSGSAVVLPSLPWWCVSIEQKRQERPLLWYLMFCFSAAACVDLPNTLAAHTYFFLF
jgi:hypothetical protein